jgi:hypothetical protein
MGSERGWGISPTHPRLTHSLEKRIRISFSQFARDYAERFRKQAAASPGRSLLIAAIESSEKSACGATESNSENGEVREFSLCRLSAYKASEPKTFPFEHPFQNHMFSFKCPPPF